ncbi:post-transcriptional regulator [Ectobacillus polymachus]|uniref:post-transcriptional regulator n=1 Tax=Ectobacillus polymachus TaxID=1508806 RepID=UPI003A8699F9
MVVKEHPADAYREQLKVVIASKVEEFKVLGYDRVTTQEIWDCLKVKKWKKIDGEMKLFQLVNDVLTLSTGDYMTYLTMEAYKTPLASVHEYETL